MGPGTMSERKCQRRNWNAHVYPIVGGFLCAFVPAEGADAERRFRLGEVTVSADVPQSMSVAHTPYGGPPTLVVRDDLDEAIRERELAEEYFKKKGSMFTTQRSAVE